MDDEVVVVRGDDEIKEKRNGKRIDTSPITGNAIDIETTVVQTTAGDVVVLILEPSVTGKVTIGNSGDGILITYQKGPHDGGGGIDVPPPA